MKNYLVETLLIPLEAYFTPSRLQARIESYVPNHYTLFQALTGERTTRMLAIEFISQIFLVTIVIPLVVVFVAHLLMPKANLRYMLGGLTASLMIGFIFGISLRMFSHFNKIMIGMIGFGVIVGSIFPVLFGIYSNLAQSTAPTDIAQAVDSEAGRLANALLLGSCVGICCRIFIATATQNVKVAMIIALIIIILIGIELSIASKPRVLMTNRVFSVTLLLSFSGWFILPLQIFIAAINYLLIRINPRLSRYLWHIAPVNWDDYFIFPALDTVPLLVALHNTDYDLFHRALRYVEQHAFQAKAAEKALKIIRSQ
jgi:hypothetical protein